MVIVIFVYYKKVQCAKFLNVFIAHRSWSRNVVIVSSTFAIATERKQSAFHKWRMIQTVLCSSLIGPEDDVWGDTLHDVKSLLLVERARDGQATPETLTRFLGFRVVHVIMTDKQQEPVSYRRCILNSVFSFDSILLFTMFYRVISNIWLKIKLNVSWQDA